MHAPIKVRGDPSLLNWSYSLERGERERERGGRVTRERGGRVTREREGRQGEEKSSFKLVSITWVYLIRKRSFLPFSHFYYITSCLVAMLFISRSIGEERGVVAMLCFFIYLAPWQESLCILRIYAIVLRTRNT